MREIVFKAKRIDNGEWVKGCLIIDYITGKYFIHSDSSVNESDKVGEEGCLQFFAFEIDQETICQYTGLNDINGNRIWENDIILDTKHPSNIGTVYFEDGEFKIYWMEHNKILRNNLSFWANKRQIIVHPELLQD